MGGRVTGKEREDVGGRVVVGVRVAGGQKGQSRAGGDGQERTKG